MGSSMANNSPDWRHRTVTAPRTVEQSISLISAGVSALDGVAMTEEEKQRVWRLIEKAIEAVGEKK